jgi:DNA-directed RNA polymerase subunit RPC12/RpoP
VEWPVFAGRLIIESVLSMAQAEPFACRHCGNAMTFATRISMPPQIVYRCEPCKTQAWILDRPPAALSQQQQQPQKDAKE